MIEFVQQPGFAIGSHDALIALAKKDTAKILLVSDSHGSEKILHEIVEKFGSDCDAMCFCGDGIPDLLKILEDGYRTPAFFQQIPPVVFFVQGNGDNSSYHLLVHDRILITVPADQKFAAAGKTVFMTHGHRFNVYFGTQLLKKHAAENDFNLVFYGHTHIANAKKSAVGDKKIMIMNPGSCSLPRGGLPHTFATVTLKKNSDLPEFSYYEMKWDSNGEFNFVPFEAPSGEVKLIW